MEWGTRKEWKPSPLGKSKIENGFLCSCSYCTAHRFPKKRGKYLPLVQSGDSKERRQLSRKDLGLKEKEKRRKEETKERKTERKEMNGQVARIPSAIFVIQM